MATYLPNSNDYLPKTKAYTPDFKFLADTLGRRQDRYNTNYKHLNQLYGQVVHADLSHKDNIHKRDEYANLLVPKIQQLTGTDFSLQQNADAAKALFKPFFEDKTLVRDIVYTKRFNNEMSKAEGYRKSSQESEREKWWQDGVDRLNYYMQDFKDASLQETMNLPLPEYVEDPDLIERGIEYLMNYEGKDKKLEIKDVVFSEDGKWMTTMVNGTVLTNRPTGIVDEETGQMGTYNPAANIIAKTILDDPIIARGYATAAYVKARKFYENESNIAKYGSPENAEKYILTQMINQGKTVTEDNIKTETEQKEKLTQQKNSWEKYLQKYPNATSESQQNYIKTLSEITAINKGIKRDSEILNDIGREYKDIAEMRNIAYQAFMNMSINKDILSAANEYAMSTMEVEKRELSPTYEKQLDFEYKAALEQLKHDNAIALEKFKQENKPGGLNINAPGITSSPGDANVNASSYAQNNDLIADNKDFLLNQTKVRVNEPMFDAVERLNTDLAAIWSDAGYEVNPTGMEVEVYVYDDGSGYMKDGNPTNKTGKWKKQFLLWPEAREYLVNGPGRNQSDLEDAYKEVLQKYHKQVSLGDEGALEPMLGTEEFNNLNTLLSQIESKVKNAKADIVTINKKANETYSAAHNMLMEKQGFEDLKTLFEKYGSPIVNTNGEPKLLSLEEYQQRANQESRDKVLNLGLPKTLKSLDQFGGNSQKWGEYIKSIFTPEVLKQLGESNYASAIRNHYMVDMAKLRNSPPNNMRNLPEQWQKSVDAAMTNMTNSFVRNGVNTDRYGRQFPVKLQTQVQMSGYDDFRPFTEHFDISNVTRKLYTEYYNTLNEAMVASNAGSGFPTFNARNEFLLKDQNNDGSIMIADNWNGTYIHGNANPEVAQQLTIALNAVNGLDKSMVSIKIGDPTQHGEKGVLENMEWDDGMQELFKQITMDLREAPSATNKPNISLTYNENINGKEGFVLQLDQEYIQKLKSTSGMTKLLDATVKEGTVNTFTIYLEKGLINNPLNTANMDVSSTKRIIETDGQYMHTVPQGGKVRAWSGSNGQIYTQIYEGGWYEVDNKWEYRETPGNPVPLMGGEAKLDELMRTAEEHLNQLANKNRIIHSKNIK